MITESPPSIDQHGANRDLDKKHWCLPYHLTQSSMGAGTLNLGDSVFLYTGNHCYMALHWSLTPLFEVDYRSSWNKGIEQAYYIATETIQNNTVLNHETLICTYVHSIINGTDFIEHSLGSR